MHETKMHIFAAMWERGGEENLCPRRYASKPERKKQGKEYPMKREEFLVGWGKEVKDFFFLQTSQDREERVSSERGKEGNGLGETGGITQQHLVQRGSGKI